MKNEEYYDLLLDQNIIIDGHFELNSGNHTSAYIQKDKILHRYITREKTTKLLTNICKTMLRNTKYNDFIITGPAVTGTIFALPIANKLKLQFVYCEKIIKYIYNNDDRQERKFMHFRPDNAKFIKGKKVIIVKDIITTGKNVIKTIAAIEKYNAEVFAVIYIWNIGNWKFKLKEQLQRTYFDGIIDKNIDNWTPDECIYCKHDIPLTQIRNYDKHINCNAGIISI